MISTVGHHGVFRTDGIVEDPLGDGFLLPFRQKLYCAGRQFNVSAACAGFGVAHIVTAAVFAVQCSADGERAFLLIEVCPHEATQLTLPQTCGDLQIEEVVPVFVSFDGFHEALQLFIIENGFGGGNLLGQGHIVGRILYDEVPVYRYIQCLVQYIVYATHRGSCQRAAIDGTFCLELAVQALDFCGGDLADLFVAKVGLDVLFHVSTVAFNGGRTYRRLRTFHQPDIQPFAQCHAALFGQFSTVIFVDALVEFLQKSFLCFCGHVMEDGVAVFLVTDHDTTFPSPIVTLSHQSVAGRSSLCHGSFLLSR